MNPGLSSGLRWFQALLLVSQVAGATVASEGRGQGSSPGNLNQVEAATILNLQTNLRRDLIRSLVDIRSKKTQFEGLHSIVGEIIQGLRSREVDPFDLFEDGEKTGQSGAAQLEKTIWNLQGEKGCAWDLSEWTSSADVASSLTVTGPTPEQLQIIRKARGPFVVTVLTKIGEGSLMLDKDLLRDILYNFRFKEYSADLEMFAENVNQMMEKRPLDFSGFDANSLKKTDEVLSAILRYLLLNLRFLPGFRYQIDRLLSALQGTTNVVRLNETAEEDEEWRLFDLMVADDYPPDVVRGKRALSRLLRGGGRRAGDLEGRPPGERLLMLVAGLTSVSEEAKVAYPHLKLRLLTSEGKFFRPRGSSDVAFLLDSFLTAHPEITPSLLQEVNAVFSSSDFDWKEVLKSFDYSRYSRPRTLFLGMVQRLLDNSAKLPVCGKTLLSYFMRINRQVASSAFVHPNDDVFIGKTENPYLGMLSDVPTTKTIDIATFFYPSSMSIDIEGQRLSGTSSSLSSGTSESSSDQSTTTSWFTAFVSLSPPSSMTTKSSATETTSEIFASQTWSPLQPSAETVTSERLLVTEKPNIPRPTLFPPLLSTASDHSEPFPPASSTYSNPEINSTSSSPLDGGRTEMFRSPPSDETTVSVSQVSDSEDQTLSSAMYIMASTEKEIVSSSDTISPDDL